MTKKEFKAAMLRGLGRCVQAVRENPEKYRDIILWACKRDIAYDAQCEGTRAWYLYTMVNAYPDEDTFVAAAADALGKYRPNGGWDLAHMAEFLSYFAEDGNKLARQALTAKFRELIGILHARKRRPNGVFHELEDLERLGVIMAFTPKSALRISGEFGRLYREKRYMKAGDFEWFYAVKGTEYKKILEQAAKEDENIALFMEKERTYRAEWDALRAQRQTNLPKKMNRIVRSRWLKSKADPETVKEYARAYREQTQPQQREEALAAFCCCPYPDDPQPVIEDANSACEELRNTAWRVLENLRHPGVREFALKNVSDGLRTRENFGLLVTNYVPKDADMLEELLQKMIAGKDWDAVHGAGMDIRRAFHKGSGIPHPKHLLPLVYGYTPCSYCRHSALMAMSRHRMLTRKILEECLYDSNDDIRAYAEKRLKK